MRPISHEGFALRDLDRSLLEQKQGMSIGEMIEKGIHVSEGLLKEHEFDMQSERERKKANSPKESQHTETFIEVNGEDMPEFDSDGLSIDYDD